ncbi:MAG: hypothetical protein AAGC46_11380, partial [Solirubrobacteraceae bacterium]|nr:hypothetical protein [Patulibacter sp.]
MTDGRPQPAIDDLLDAFIAAWHAGDAPDAAAFVDRAEPADRDELEQLIAAFLELAPTVGPTEPRAAELAGDPLVARLSSLEDDWWDARDGVAKPWGATLRGLREKAGLSIASVAASFAAQFGLGAEDAAAAPDAFEALERGTSPAAGVAARAARALEQLLDAPRGVLVAGVAPALADPRLRGALPETAEDRDRFTALLREVDD